MTIFTCSTKILAGHGILHSLREFGASRVFLVTDPYFVQNGVAEQVLSAAGAAASAVFDQVAPDPTVELAAQGAARVKEFRPDLIVALGGGSAMDCAKAICYFGNAGCPLAAIPTTSGSGSEVTDFAILTHQGVKHPLVDERLRPSMAILDGTLLEKLPKALIADTGFDVLAHALEACCATKGGPFTACLARESFATAYRCLPGSFAGDTSLRLDIHQAATMAGLAFNQAGLGLCHAMAHALGGAFHIPHGRLNAILLPAVLSCNAPKAQGQYTAMARAAGICASSETIAVRNLKSALIRLRRELGLPETLRQAGVDLTQLRRREQQIIEAALSDPCCETNPVKVEAHMIRQILTEAAGHG